MIPDPYVDILNDVAQLHHHFAGIIDTWFLVFCRMMGFFSQAPVFNRKDMPFNIKLTFATLLSWIMLWNLPHEAVTSGKLSFADNSWLYLIQIMVNGFLGAFFGLLADMILNVVNAAGSLMNNQISLSSAMMSDPATKKQAALFEVVYAMIAAQYFIYIGGLYWLIEALHRTFTLFPVDVINIHLTQQIDINYIIYISGNSLAIGTAMVAPIFVVTMCFDMILGIVNRTAQQIQVFQLSMALKPCIGLATFLATVPILMKFLFDYFNDFSKIF